MDDMTSDEYKKAFGLRSDSMDTSDVDKTKSKQALDVALDIRKFEIDLYWKRTAYFWALLTGTLAGYFALLVSNETPKDARAEALLTISCLGLVISVAWYFVNRASKYWQENWEKHVDLLEDEHIGPLYKTVVSHTKHKFWNLNGSYRFSASKLNQLLSLFMVVLFLLFMGTTLCRYYRFGCPQDWFATILIILTAVGVMVLFCKGKTRSITDVIPVHAERRTTKIEDN